MQTAQPQKSARPVIEVVGVHKSFGGLEVLKGVSLTAREGEVVVLIGSSGSGKSTLLRCINMLEVPEAGEVRIAGEPIRLSREGPHRHIADEGQIRRIRSSSSTSRWRPGITSRSRL